MYRIQPTETLASLINTFKQWGGLIDYVQIGEEDALLSENSSAQHTRAAIFTAQTVTDAHIRYRRERFRKQEAEMKKLWPWLSEENTYRVDQRKGTDIRPEEAQGHQLHTVIFLLRRLYGLAVKRYINFLRGGMRTRL